MFAHTSDSIECLVLDTLCKRFKTDYTKRLRQTPIDKLVTDYLNGDIDPNAYTDPHEFSKDYLVYSFLRKWKGWDIGLDPEETALRGWTSSEQSCLHTNRFFDLPFRPDLPALRLISKIQRKIEKVIGLEPDFEELDKLCRWGPGATFDLRRTQPLDAASKMSSELSYTKRALAHFLRVIDPVWKDARGDLPMTEVRGNRCVMVAKNAKTHRPIAAEPTVNSFLQQAVGRYFKRCLKAFGINLKDQSINQRLAFAAIVDALSTIDLRSASDTLARAVVHLLLPKAWVTYLEDLRSPYTFLNGKWYRLEKFSSMGNAFTFELESLIFWAICSVVCENDDGPVSVFGDDIIVPRSAATRVVAALRYFGFETNIDKSFIDGNFFESCGKHYHSLEDVTPVYQKELCKSDLGELVRLHNRLYRWGKRNRMHLVKDAMSLIIEHTRSCHPKLGTLPETPHIEADLGFITDDHSRFKVNKHGDFTCRVLMTQNVSLYAIRPIDHQLFYAYKLRVPSSRNPHPDGGCGFVAGEQTRLLYKRVWRSSLVM